MWITRRITLTHFVLGILACMLPLLLTGCFLRLLFGAVVPRDAEFGTVFIAEMGGTWGPMAICDFEEDGTLVDCSYTFLDFEAEPPIIERTSSAQLISELGILGVFVDPVILQVPAGASNFTGTFDDGSGPQAITETGSFSVQPGTEVAAEPGQKFVILEFPPDVEADLTSSGQLDGPFDFNFEFEVPSLAPVDVKAMFAGKVEVGGQTFYAPLLPCVTDFANVPALTIPDSPSQADLMPQVLSILNQNANLACDGTVYDYTALGGPAATEVAIDIKPQSCPNPVNTKSNGVLPVAILGTTSFDVNDVDLSSVQLEGISPLRSSLEDVSSPVADPQDACDCTTDGPDGFDDLTLKFDTQDLVAALGAVDGDEEITLTLTANLLDGTSIEGQDCVVIRPKGGKAEKAEASVPERFALFQNHPNPFNPATQIRFALPEAVDVQLVVYDGTGREVARLVDGPMPAGQHQIEWRANRLPSGVYLYRLTAGRYVETRRMALVK